MTSTLTFSAGDTVWHVRHGKVTLEARHKNGTYPVYAHGDSYTINGKVAGSDVGRVLYTLAEAEQYGWYKPEPLRVEFTSVVGNVVGVPDEGSVNSIYLHALKGKRVKVTAEELP